MAHTANNSFMPPRWVLTILFLWGICWVLVELKELCFLMVVGYSIAYIVDPVLDKLEERNISRSIGVFLVFGALSIVAVALVVTAVPTVIRDFKQFAAGFPDYIEIVSAKLGPYWGMLQEYLPSIGESTPKEALLENLPSVDSKTVTSFTSGLLKVLLSGYSITLTIINLTILPFIIYYLAVDLDRFHRACIDLVPYRRQRRIRAIAGEINTYVSAFVQGQVLVGAILFFLYAIGLGAVGVDLWLLLAVISGFGNIIPYVGFMSGITLSTIMAIVTFGDFTHVLFVWGVYAIVQALEGTLITPRIIGDKVGLSPLIVLIALIAGGTLFGLLGIFLAIPIVAALRVLLSHLHEIVIQTA